MKIAFICTEKLPVPPVAGGAVQLYIDGILPYLSQQHELTVFCVEHPGLPTEEVKENVRYIRVPARSKNHYLNNVMEQMSKDFDLVHVFNRPLWILPLSEKFPASRFSLSLHNEMFHPEKISASDAEKVIQRVEFINTVSRFIADGVKTLYPMAEDKLNVVYSGADISMYKPMGSEEGIVNKIKLKEKYQLQDYKVVLFVGRLSIKKGVHTLLKAMKKVMDTSADTALVIIGSKWFGENEEDDYTRSLKTLANELPGPIVFTGFLPPSEIPQHYNIGDIFVCSSQWNEPLARVHYEAMAAGLPIITTNRGGNAEVITHLDNGLVIDKYKSSGSFAESINFLLNNPDKALALGNKGRLLAEEKYGWDRVAKDVLKPLIDKNKEG